MKLNPQQAPLYGHCVITVQLSDDELAGSEEGMDYFLLFAGSTQRHLTSTLRSSHDTLQALCPAHDCCEVVLVTLCSVTQGVPEEPQSHLVHVAPLAEHRFSFVQDLAFDMAQFLVSTVGRADGLDGALLLDECQIPLQECERLDESLALALHHLKLPTGWNLLGNKRSNSTDLNPQETLLHFSARRGLFQVTHFLLQQAGARGALRLANRQGYTPSAVAELRGHKCLHELLTKAETEPEKDEESDTVQQVSEDVQVFCHLPKLNTHTLTLSIHPGRDPPSFQKSVEQLLHLICHLHAKGVSVLKLQFDSLHTAAECSDGVEAHLTCLDRLQQSDTASECPDTTTQGSWLENCPVESNSTVDCRQGEPGNAEKDCSLTVSTPTSEVHPQEHGLVPPGDWVCSNTERDYSKAEEEEEEQERPVVSMQSLSLSDRSEGVQSEAEGKSLTVGILPQAGCGKQAEETDRGEAVIQEGQEAKKGEDRSEQEAEDSSAKRREEEISSELTDLLKASGDTNESIMGQSASSSYSEVSDNSDSEVKECSQEEENVGKEDAKHSRDVSNVLSLDENEEESEGLTDTLSTPMDLPDPTLIECGDVIKEPQPVPCLLIEGLHEGEPLPDINSLEQNQETAGRDYATEQEWGLASESGCHSGSCTDAVGGKELHSEDVVEPSGYSIESSILPVEEADSSAVFLAFSDVVVDTQTDTFNCEPLPDKMPTERQADHDSGTAHGLSSDDDGSFRSAGSSTTEIFQPAHGSVAMEDQDLLQSTIVQQSSAGFEIEARSDFKPKETCEHFTTVDTGLSSEPDTQFESEPKLLSLDDLNSEATENLAPDLSKEDLSFDSARSEDTPTVQVEESETEETNSSDLNVGIELSASGLGSGILTETEPPVTEESKVINIVEEDVQQTSETSDMPVVVAADESGNVQPKQDNSEITAEERLPENQITLSIPQGDIVLSNSADLSSSEITALSLKSEGSIELHTENLMTENPSDFVDGSLESCGTKAQEVDVIKSEDTLSDAGEEQNGPAEGADFSTIHRDRETSFHQPCNTQHSGSSESSTFSSLPSRTSSATSCPSSAHRDSGSDIESFLNAEPGYDSIFRKNDEPVTGGDSASEVSVSCSSTDDTASVGPTSSSPEGSQGLGCSWSPEEGIQTVAPTTEGLDSGGGGGAGEAEEEAKDRVTEVPRRSCLFRNSNRSLSPLRRHSWGPGKNNGGDGEMNQRSSTRSSGERKPAFHRRRY
uniref:Si:dkey-172h23.2 n=1 Tax=Oreochromis niloticus TaxID=8128 RepID=A0A669CH86_ORENI